MQYKNWKGRRKDRDA